VPGPISTSGGSVNRLLMLPAAEIFHISGACAEPSVMKYDEAPSQFQ
jgi:hypothetical protein